MAVAAELYGPPLTGGSTPTPPVTIDATGLTTTVPLLVKNGRSQSGVVVQVTGTVASGFVLNDSAGTARGVFGYAVSANDWITQSAAGDTVLLGDSAKMVRIGPIGGANTLFNFDLVNSRFGVGAGTNSPSYAVHVIGTDTASGRVEIVQGTASSQAIMETNTGSCFTSVRAHGSTTAGTGLGVTLAGTSALFGSPTANGMLVGSQSAFPLVFGVNDVEYMRILSGGGIVSKTLKAVASAAGAVWDGVDLGTSTAASCTATVSGSTNITTAAGFNQVVVRIPTITSGSALTITNAASLVVAGAPVAAGSTTITNTISFWVQGSQSRFDGQVYITDGANMKFDTTTGTKLGTGTTQKIGLWNATPVIQPATAGTTTGFTANASANALFNESTFTGGTGTKAYTVSDIVLALKQAGVMAAS